MADPARTHEERLSWEMQSWQAIEMTTHLDFENASRQGANEFAAYRSDEHYVETATGKRLYEERVVPSGASAPLVTTSYCDGSKCAERFQTVEGERTRDQVMIKRAFKMEDTGQTSRPGPLKVFYVGLDPLPKALSRASYLGEKSYQNRDCDLFLFSKERFGELKYEYVYWIDRASSVPVRVEQYLDQASRAEGRLASDWSAKSIDEFEGRHFSRRFELVCYLPKSSGRRGVYFRINGEIESVRFNGDYPNSLFWPATTKETAISDTINKTFTPASTPLPFQQKAATTAPIRAGTGPSWTSLSLRAGLLTSGLLLFVAGVLVWRKRR